VVPGRRKANHHLPRRVYAKHGALWFVDIRGKWHRLGPVSMPASAMHARLAELLEAAPAGTMGALFERYRREVLPTKAKRTASVQGHELRRLAAVFGHMPIGDVMPSDCWGYYTTRGSGSAAHHEVRLLSHVFTWALRWGLAKLNPARGLGLKTPKPRTRYVTDAEYVAFRETAGPMVAYAMDLSLLAALRQGDVLALERRDLTEDGIVVRPGKTEHSTGKELLIEWDDTLRAVKDACLRENPQVRRFLICRRDGKGMTSHGFQSIWQRLMAKWVAAGGERFTFHDIRAKSLSDTDTLQEAASRAGHADARITARVYRRLPERVKALAILDSGPAMLDRPAKPARK
jgi:integrase